MVILVSFPLFSCFTLVYFSENSRILIRILTSPFIGTHSLLRMSVCLSVSLFISVPYLLVIIVSIELVLHLFTFIQNIQSFSNHH